VRSISMLPVRSKFTLLLGVVAFGLVACAGIGLFATNNLAGTALEEVERLGLWARVQDRLLQARRNEKDYMLRSLNDMGYYSTGRSTYVDLHAASLKDMRALLRETEQRYIQGGDQGQVDFEELGQVIDAYERSFQELVAASLSRGFTETGLIGDMLRAGDQLSRLAQGDPTQALAVLNVRRCEDDYLLHPEDKDTQNFRAGLDALRASPLGKLPEGLAAIERYGRSYEAMLKLDEDIGRTEDQGITGRMRAAIHKLEPIVQREIDRVHQDRTHTSQQILETRLRLMTLNASSCLAIIVVVFLLGRSIARGLGTAIESLRKRVAELRAGSLDVKFEPIAVGSRDDVDLLDDDVSQLAVVMRSFVAASQNASRTIETGFKEVQRALSELSSGYAQQSTAVSQTVTTLDELRASAVSGNDRAKEVVDQARQVTDTARKGSDAVDAVTQGMGTIRSQVEQIATSVLHLSDRAEQIGEIVSSVNGIADQSKLLALNAAIEAAKAGEYGHGFAVVAEEVRALAERSQSATREITGILKEIQKATNAAVMATEDGSKSVARGLELVDTSRSTIQTLSSTIESSSRAVEQITYSVGQQTAGVTQINDAMNGILAAVQQGNSESQRIKETMGDAAQQLVLLREVVSRFRGAAVTA
jgi:methyl-accepting chemotaxis protein